MQRLHNITTYNIYTKHIHIHIILTPIFNYVCQILANTKSQTQQIVVILNLLQTIGKSTSLSHSGSTSVVYKRKKQLKKHMQIAPATAGGKRHPNLSIQHLPIVLSRTTKYLGNASWGQDSFVYETNCNLRFA